MDQFNEFRENIAEKATDLRDSITEKAASFKGTDVGSKSFLSHSKDFLESNTLIAKTAFLLFVLLIFCLLFYVFSRALIYFMTPSESPYVIKGMKDATQPLTIAQTPGDKSSVPIFRSRNEVEGIEFTYSVWLYVNDMQFEEDFGFKHVFHKGNTQASDTPGIYGPNNCPGVYLYKGKKNIADNLLDKFPLLGVLIRLNVFNDNDNTASSPYKYYDDVYVDGLPIKKWVNLIVRVTNQNMVDVYVNGTLTKSHKLSNIIKQNYDNLYVSMNGGFPGSLSNLKYYNYAIGTFEINRIKNAGPDLTIAGSSSLQDKKADYLSQDWYFGDTDVVRG